MEKAMDLGDGSSTTDSLYPALFQCFTIIFCGYIAGRLNVVSQTEAKGIGTFVGTFALPSLIFVSLAQLDFSTVNWTFLCAILLAKGIVFFSVIFVTLLISKPTHLGRAGIFAIFCTQSNDFALGYPIINAIYKITHPEYGLFLYLMAPISLAILNPVAFVLMEIQKQKDNTQSQDMDELRRKHSVGRLKVLRQIVTGIALNPVLVMTVLGIVGNVLFKQNLTIYIKGLLEIFGQSFSASALFLLGLRMVGQIHRLRGPALLIPGVLIMTKLIILPVILRECVTVLHAGYNETETVALSTYAFLYGTIPAAPAVFVFSNLYQLEIDLMASSMVVCTLVSAPMMFLSAQLITITKDFADQLKRFGFDLSIAALVASVWVLLIFLFTKKYKRMPHRLTMCLLVTQILLSISVICGGRSPGYVPSVLGMLQQALTIFCMYSCALWTSMLSIGLLMLESRGPCFVVALWPVLCFVAWGAPAVIVAVLLVSKARDLNLEGNASEAVRLCLLVFCITVSTGCLLVYMRFRRRSARFASLSSDVASGTIDGSTNASANESTGLVDSIEPTSVTRPQTNGMPDSYGTINGTVSSTSAAPENGCCSNDPHCTNGNLPDSSHDIEDIANDQACACPPSQRSRCATAAAGPCSYLTDLELAAHSLGLLPPEQSRGRGSQLLKHTVLVILYSLTMFIGITYTTWRMMLKTESGTYIEIEFLDVAANYGQGLIMLLLFGLNPEELIIPLVRHVKNKWLGADTVTLPAIEDLSFETKHVCDQFINHHFDRCKDAIAKDTRWRMRTYKSVFRGSCLVRWLISTGLAKDQHEAVQYGRHLLDGRLIAHINNAHHFTDSPLLYAFK